MEVEITTLFGWYVATVTFQGRTAETEFARESATCAVRDALFSWKYPSHTSCLDVHLDAAPHLSMDALIELAPVVTGACHVLQAY